MLKTLFIILGTISLILGTIGIFVPGLPTTPFLLLTAGLYIRSSEKLYFLLIRNKYLGKYIVRYQKDKGMTIRTKIYSITLMWIMIVVSTIYFLNSISLIWIIISVGFTGTVIMGFLIPTINRRGW